LKFCPGGKEGEIVGARGIDGYSHAGGDGGIDGLDRIMAERGDGEVSGGVIERRSEGCRREVGVALRLKGCWVGSSKG
jgi:hypothetical protein